MNINQYDKVKKAYADGLKAHNPNIPSSACNYYSTKDENDAFNRGWEDAETRHLANHINAIKSLQGLYDLISVNCPWKSFGHCKPAKQSCDKSICALYKAIQIYVTYSKNKD